jgi:rubrerythrin
MFRTASGDSNVEFPQSVRAEISSEIGSDVSVGFLYSRFHIFYANMWTWNGRFVLYHGEEYVEIPASGWHGMIGEDPKDKYEKPFLYRYPLGLIILGSIVALWIIWSRIYQPKSKKLAKLFRDSRYTETLEKLFPDSEPALTSKYGESAFNAAVSNLHSKGISRSRAETNLQMMAEAVLAERNAQIDHTLRVAASLAQRGEYPQSCDVLEQLIGALPESDPRFGPATDLLAEFQEKRPKSTGIEPAHEGERAEPQDTTSPPIGSCSSCGTLVLPRADATCPSCAAPI